MALVNLSKFAICAFLVCTMVSTFGSGAELVIKEVVRNIDEKCSNYGEMCCLEKDCCKGFVCVVPLIWPPVPGTCLGPVPQIKESTQQPLCAHKGQSCFPKYGVICCEGLFCSGSYDTPGTCFEL